MMMANSSPPNRATVLCRPGAASSRRATSHRTRSPTPCPWTSLTGLNRSRSIRSSAHPPPVWRARCRSRFEFRREDTAVRQARQSVVSRQEMGLFLSLARSGMSGFEIRRIGAEDLEGLCHLSDLVPAMQFGDAGFEMSLGQSRQRRRHRPQRSDDPLADVEEDEERQNRSDGERRRDDRIELRGQAAGLFKESLVVRPR